MVASGQKPATRLSLSEAYALSREDGRRAMRHSKLLVSAGTHTSVRSVEHLALYTFLQKHRAGSANVTRFKTTASQLSRLQAGKAMTASSSACSAR